jgi:hypothetical protein
MLQLYQAFWLTMNSHSGRSNSLVILFWWRCIIACKDCLLRNRKASLLKRSRNALHEYQIFRIPFFIAGNAWLAWKIQPFQARAELLQAGFSVKVDAFSVSDQQRCRHCCRSTCTLLLGGGKYDGNFTNDDKRISVCTRCRQ